MSTLNDLKDCIASICIIRGDLVEIWEHYRMAPNRELIHQLSALEDTFELIITQIAHPGATQALLDFHDAFRNCRSLLREARGRDRTQAEVGRTIQQVRSLVGGLPFSKENVPASLSETKLLANSGYDSRLPPEEVAQKLQRLNRGFNADIKSFRSARPSLNGLSEPGAKPMYIHYPISEDRSGDRESVARAILAALGPRSVKESAAIHPSGGALSEWDERRGNDSDSDLIGQ